MRFFGPWQLLWLLPLAGAIIFLYLLKLRRREVVVSSVMLWTRLLRDVQANAPFQKLRRNLLLLLQLLILLLVILGLSRPYRQVESLGGQSAIIILDGSASMQSRDAGGSRFDAARKQALQMVDELRRGDRMMVLLATSRPQKLTDFTTDKAALRRALSAARPMDTETHLLEVLQLAVSSATSTGIELGGSRIIVFSDGAFGELGSLDAHGNKIHFIKVGRRSENVGIVAMDARRSLQDEEKYQVFVAIRNYGTTPRKCALEFYRDDILIDARALELPPADRELGFSEIAEIYQDLPPLFGLLTARIDLKDDLEVDNVAYTEISPPQKINVLLVGSENLFLERALNVDPNVKLSEVSLGGYQQQEGFDVVVFEDEAPAELGPGAHLFINCGGATSPVSITGRVNDASIVDWERLHSVMRFVSLNNLVLREALTAKAQPWGVTLAEHENGPVIAIGTRENRKSAYIGFPIITSDFPLRPAFPILMNNLLQWLAATPGRSDSTQMHVGDSVPITVPAGVETLTVKAPGSGPRQVKAQSPTTYLDDTERVGIYTVEWPDPVKDEVIRKRFALNLLSRDESNTKPRDQIDLGNQPVLANQKRPLSAREFWRTLLLLAMGILALEWYVFHRRI